MHQHVFLPLAIDSLRHPVESADAFLRLQTSDVYVRHWVYPSGLQASALPVVLPEKQFVLKG